MLLLLQILKTVAAQAVAVPPGKEQLQVFTHGFSEALALSNVARLAFKRLSAPRAAFLFMQAHICYSLNRKPAVKLVPSVV